MASTPIQNDASESPSSGNTAYSTNTCKSSGTFCTTSTYKRATPRRGLKRDTDSMLKTNPSASASTRAPAEMPTVVPKAARMSGQRAKSASHL